MHSINKKRRVFIGIGSNLRGHMSIPKKNIKIVFNYLQRNGLRVERFSKTYYSRPYPNGLGPLFCNIAVLINTDKSALSILKSLKKIENIFGRRRIFKNSPRVIDLDIIDYAGEVINFNKQLILPHPKISSRDFVLYPILDLDPRWKDPITFKTVKELLVKYSKKNINKIDAN